MNNSGSGGGFLSGASGGISDLESPFHSHRHPYFGKGKAVGPSNHVNNNDLSKDDVPSYAVDGNCENLDGGKCKKGSTLQRIKWTDNMVGLLLEVVNCVVDDGTIGDGMDGVKRKSGVLQKKGKWKTVSEIMISKGCHVSPQQCEDKFNDLNRRYKRLNDILGRGTCCQVVENPALMDSMPNLSAKAKDDVRKILSSKNLFHKEMCAYHNRQRLPNSNDLDLHGYSLEHRRDSRDNNGSEDEAEDNNESEDYGMDNEININADGDGRRVEELCDRNEQSEEDGHLWPRSVRMDKFQVEMARVFQDSTKPLWERREWIKMQLLQLQEENVGYEAQALELEKHQFKWLRYCSEKDRELEKQRLENKRMKLENEHKILKLKQKDPPKPLWERREWIMMQLLQLQEENVGYEAQALELEKHQFKWLRYCSEKDRELEKQRLENKRMKLENEHKILKLKQKEHETDCSRFGMSLAPASHGTDRPQGREGAYQPGPTAVAPPQKGSRSRSSLFK